MRAAPGVGAAPALLALLGLLGPLACLGQSPPRQVDYVLRPERPGPAAAEGAGVLRVGRVRVAPLFERKGFVYRTHEQRYVHDFYHRFYAPPGVVVQEALADWLRASGRYAAVLDPGEAGSADVLLEGRVEELYADLRDEPRVRLALELTLLDARSLGVRLQRRYAAWRPASGPGPEALAAAWTRALVAVLGDLESDLAALPAAGAAPAGAGAKEASPRGERTAIPRPFVPRGGGPGPG